MLHPSLLSTLSISLDTHLLLGDGIVVGHLKHIILQYLKLGLHACNTKYGYP